MATTTHNQPGRATWLALLAAVVAAICYLNSLPNGFVSDDDHLIFQHPFTTHVKDWPRILTSGHYEGSGGYRPVTTFSFALNYAAGGANPVGYHLVNVVLHALNSALVFLLLARLSGSNLAAGIAALIFAVHPVHTEAVAWTSGRAELLATGLFLLAWLFHLNARPRGSIASPWQIASLAAFFAATLSKENALVFPVAILLGDCLIARRQPSDSESEAASWRPAKSFGVYLLYFGVAAFYFAFRLTLYRRPLLRLPSQIQFVDNPLSGSSVITRALTALKIQGEYLWLLVWPKNLCADYSFNSVPLVTKLSWPLLLGLGAATVLTGILTIRSFRRRERLWFCIVFYLLAIFPVSNLPTLIGTLKAERLLYLPSLGFCAALGLMCDYAWPWWRGRFSSSRPAAGLAIALLACIGGVAAVRTWQRNEIWRNEDTLWTSVIEVAPDNLKAQLMVGEKALREGRPADAVPALTRAHQIDPSSEDAIINLGTAFLQVGFPERAATLYEEALQRDPNRSAFHLNLGLAYVAMNKPASGVRELQRAAELEPGNAVVHFDLGLALSRTGDPYEAIRAYRKAIELKSDYAEAWNGLGGALLKSGRREEARTALQHALQLNPNYHDAIYNMTLLDSTP